MANLEWEIKRRRTFAIISHPDAGKTTLTEKLLLYGGAIAQAGQVKGKKHTRAATSDWMEIEKQRGISVTSSVMQFQYDGFCINILDTPGHQDFSEDTYRTLMAADSAVMVLDGAKGVEAQTRKLFQVCAMKHIPIFTFINKMDREVRDPFELCQELEDELGLETYPVNWPIGCGKDFRGVYDRQNRKVISFEGVSSDRADAGIQREPEDPALREVLGEDLWSKLVEDIELLDGAACDFDLARVRGGTLSPVFFGSARTSFGVEPFLEAFLHMTTCPLPRQAGEVWVDCMDPHFSAFVFKIQANMNRAHRDRIAFLRIVSGKFEAEREVLHVQGKRKLRLSRPQQLMAAEREIVEEAYGGDIIGVFDPGIFSLGDTLCHPAKQVQFDPIPTFAPSHFYRIRSVDTMKRKQFVKGVEQIAQEGAIQIFRTPDTGMEEVIVGVVGCLQFDVLEYRMKWEYGVELSTQTLVYESLRWVLPKGEEPWKEEELMLPMDVRLAQDYRGNQILLFGSQWSIQWVQERNSQLQLMEFGNLRWS